MVEPIEGYQMTPSQKERMLMVRSHLAFVQQSIDSLDSKLDELVAPYENAISLLCTIPGIDRACLLYTSFYICKVQNLYGFILLSFRLFKI